MSLAREVQATFVTMPKPVCRLDRTRRKSAYLDLRKAEGSMARRGRWLDYALGARRYAAALCCSLQFPVPGKQLGYTLGEMVLQASQHFGQLGLLVDVVELCRLDQREDGGGAAADGVGAGEGPVVVADRDAAQRAFGSVVGHAQAAVIDEDRS